MINKSILFIAIIVFGSANYSPAKDSWTPISAEQKEYDFIMTECRCIDGRFENKRSSCYHNAIFYYLKEVGTPMSLVILKEYVQSGRLPKSYLNLV